MKNTLLSLLVFCMLLFALGQNTVFAQNADAVNLVLDPATVNVKPGDTFEIAVKAVPNNQQFQAMDVFLDFDPRVMEVVDALPAEPGIQVKPLDKWPVQPTPLNPVILANQVDNFKGEITFCVGIPIPKTYDSNSPVTVATVTFKVKANATGSAPITFHTVPGRQTQVAYSGVTVWGTLTGAGVAINTTPATVPPVTNPETPTVKPPAATTPPPDTSIPPPTTLPPATIPPAATTTNPAVSPTSTAPATISKPAATATSTANPSVPPASASKPTPAPATKTSLPSGNLLSLPWWAWVIIGVVVVIILGRLVVWFLSRKAKAD